MKNSRLLYTAIVLFALAIGEISRLYYIQIVKHDEFVRRAKKQHIGLQSVKAARGMIYDRTMNVLAYSKDDVSFYADMRMITSRKNRDTIASRYSRITGRSFQYYTGIMQLGLHKNVCLEQKISGEKALLLKQIKRDGLFFEEDPTRIYPFEQTGSHLLGYVTPDDTGKDGIERSYDKHLRGKDGSRVILKDPIGNMVAIIEESTTPAKEGEHIVLTIDKNIQTILEEELLNGQEITHAKSLTGIIIDPGTGEILALANARAYNPNRYFSYSDTVRRNKAVTDLIEPGSTFKSFSFAVLLDKQLTNEEEIIPTERGVYHFKGTVIKDAHPFNQLAVKDILAQSSNIGMAKLSQRIDNESFYKYLRSFGFGSPTGISLPGEVRGKLKKPSQWSGLTKSSISFGYEIMVSPIQLAIAYASLINGGTLFQPMLVKSVINQNGESIMTNNPKEVGKVITPETSMRMKKLLTGVIENGTGKKAKIIGMQVGGKTGTSRRMVNDSYSTQYYNASFIGFFPADQPKYLCLILVDSPIDGSYYGGDVAAPIFKHAAEKIIEYDASLTPFKNNIEPSTQENHKYYSSVTSSGKDSNDIPVKFTSKDVAIKSGYMPDLLGVSVRKAISVLTTLKMKYEFSGSGKVISQSIQPGSIIKPGMKVILKGNISESIGGLH